MACVRTGRCVSHARMSLRDCCASTTAPSDYSSRDKNHHAHRLGYGGNCARARAAPGSLSKVRPPYVEITVIDRAVAVPVGGKSGAGLAQRIAPQHVVGVIDNTIAVVIAEGRQRDTA